MTSLSQSITFYLCDLEFQFISAMLKEYLLVFTRSNYNTFIFALRIARKLHDEIEIEIQ